MRGFGVGGGGRQPQIPFGNDKQRASKLYANCCFALAAFAGVGGAGAVVVGDALGAAEEHEEQGFLGVHAVFGLVEDYGLGAVEDLVGDFGVAVGGEAVHEDGVWLGVEHEGFVDLVGFEDGGALGGLVLEAHAGADVGIDGVGSGDGFDGIVHEGDAAAGGFGDLDGLVDDLEFGGEAFGCGDGAVCAELCGGEDEGVADVVAVADVGEVETGCGAEALFEGEEVGDGLAGVFEVGEGVDDGDAGGGSHLGDGVVGVGAEDDEAHPALDVVGHIGEGFAFAEGGLGLVDEDGVAAEGVDGGLEGEAGAEAGLLEEHDELAGVEGVAEVFGVIFDGVGELHDGGHLLNGEVGDAAEVAAGEALGGFGEGGVGLDAELYGGLRGCCRFFFGGFVGHDYGFATHEIFLLLALRRRRLLH
jgi:hypothetical protein